MSTKRLVDPSSDATELERRLLAASADGKPRASDRAAVWQRLMIGLTELPEVAAEGLRDEAPLPADPDLETPPAQLPAPAPAASLAPPLTWAPLVLSGVFGLVVGVVATTSFFLLRDDASPPAPSAPASPASASPRAASVEPRTTGTRGDDSVEPARTQSPPSVAVENLRPLTRPNAAQPSGAAEPMPSGSPASQLRQEAALLRLAREQLGRGALTEASSTLTQSRVAFPDSRLSQEREALTIELYVRQGRMLEARSLARAFLSKHPQSPHAAQVRRALETGSQD